MATRTPAKKKAPRPDRRKPGASELISALLEDLTNNKNLIVAHPDGLISIVKEFVNKNNLPAIDAARFAKVKRIQPGELRLDMGQAMAKEVLTPLKVAGRSVNLITELPTEQQNDAVALILKRLQDHRVARLQHTKQQLDFSVSEHEAAMNNDRRLKTIISGDFTIIGPQ